MAKKRGNKSAVSVDLSKVEAGGKVLPEGKYAVSISAATLESSQSGNDYIKLELQVSEGDQKDYKLYHNCSLQPQALFNLKGVLLALGFPIPKKAFDLDLGELVGSECSVEVAHEKYEGKQKARIVEFMGADEEDEEEEESALENLELDELQDLAKELGIKAKDIKKAKNTEALIELIEEEAEEDDIEKAMEKLFDEEEDEDEEDEEEDYSEMSIDELKEECKDRGIKVGKKAKKADLVALLEEDDEE